MSNIGNKKIKIPNLVTVLLKNNLIVIKGQYGILERKFNASINIILENNFLVITRINNFATTRAYHGLIRALIQNMIIGVNQKFCKILITEGIGYKFQLKNNVLILFIGYTHSIEFLIPNNITIILESQTKILLYSINYEELTLFTSQIKAKRLPEPYNGKGILYHDEIIRKKEGKKRK